MAEQELTDSAVVSRFYDALRSSGLSAAALVHGEAYIGQERQPMPAEQRQYFCALWRFPSLETPQSYLEAVRAAGLRLLYHADTSTYAVRFYTRLLAVYRERRAEFEAIRGPERYLEGLERLQMSQQCATTGV